MRSFEIGDLVICIESGVIGRVLRFYVPTACEEQTMVLTRDGRQYHAPTRFWEKYCEEIVMNGNDRFKNCDECMFFVEVETGRGKECTFNGFDTDDYGRQYFENYCCTYKKDGEI